MNQSELILSTSLLSGVSKKDTEATLKASGKAITSELANGGEVTLPGLGKLVAIDKPARVGKNPKTGEPLTIPARKVVKFKPGAALKHAVA